MKVRILNLLNLASIIAMAATLMSFFLSDFYLPDILANFKIQYTLYFIFIALLNLMAGKKILTILSLIFCGLNVSALAPFYSSTQNLTNSKKIFYANVLSHNRNYQGLINQIEKEDPQIIGLVELNHAWAQALAPIMSKYPHMIMIPQEDNFGLALFSKEEFLDVEEVKSAAGLSSIHAIFPHFELFLTHPLPPVSTQAWKLRNEHYEEIVKKFKSTSAPLIIFGDFNSVPWSKYLKQFASALELKIVGGLQPTWHSSFPPGFQIGLDHAFVSKKIKANKRILKKFGSDHLPFLLELEL